MKPALNRALRSLTCLAAMLGNFSLANAAEETVGTTQSSPSVQTSSEKDEVRELKQQLADQQKQIEELRIMLLNQQKQISEAAKATSTAPAETVQAAALSTPVSTSLTGKGIGEVAS